jgi:putative oxidoreductase
MPQAMRGALSLTGRVLLGAIFLLSALGNKIPNFSKVAGYMGSVGMPAPELMLVGAIVFLLVGGVSLVLGWQARLGSVLLLVFLALATYYFHPFWKMEGMDAQNHMAHAMKNLSIAGALLFIVANGPGAWSVDGRRSGAAHALTPENASVYEPAGR